MLLITVLYIVTVGCSEESSMCTVTEVTVLVSFAVT